jgi:pimeloyl-ACP methyl ester carboxylesterase
VLAVLDALSLRRPVLAGHSIAGEELSSMATRHPERVAGLIYLDAAYGYAFYDNDRGDLVLDLAALRQKLEQLKTGNGLRDTRPADQGSVANGAAPFRSPVRIRGTRACNMRSSR